MKFPPIGSVLANSRGDQYEILSSLRPPVSDVYSYQFTSKIIFSNRYLIGTVVECGWMENNSNEFWTLVKLVKRCSNIPEDDI